MELNVLHISNSIFYLFFFFFGQILSVSDGKLPILKYNVASSNMDIASPKIEIQYFFVIHSVRSCPAIPG